jgi:predicted nucleic acid-binding protein
VCLIVDANVGPKFLLESSAIIDWLFGDRGAPRLVAAGKLREELAANRGVSRQLVQLDRAGRLRSADPKKLEDEERRLRIASIFRSNDPHVLALAIVSGARTLATGDNALADDFKNKRIIDAPRGKVYRDPEAHRHLLCHTSSCGVDPGPSRRPAKQRQ